MISPHLTQPLIALTLAISGVAIGCSNVTPAPDPAIEIVMEPIPKQPWAASGELVDIGQFCAAGSRAEVGLFFPDGTPMMLADFMQGIDEVKANGGTWEDFEFIALEEYTCDDGSGSFTMREESGDGGRWEVVSGTGAYLGMIGEGTHAIVTDLETAEPLSLRAIGTFRMGPDNS